MNVKSVSMLEDGTAWILFDDEAAVPVVLSKGQIFTLEQLTNCQIAAVSSKNNPSVVIATILRGSKP